MTSRNAARVRSLLGMLLSVAILWIIAQRVDLEQMLAAAKGISWPWAVAALGVLILDYELRIVRWWLLLRAGQPGLPLMRCVAPLLIGVAANNLLPLRAGDALRAFGFQRYLGAPAMRVMGTLAVERALDTLSLLVMLAIAIAAGARVAGTTSSVNVPLALAILAAALLFFAMCRSPRLRDWLLSQTRSSWLVRSGRSELLHRQLQHLLEVFAKAGEARHAVGLTAISLLIWTLEGGVFGCAALALGIPGFAAAWLSLAVGTLATLVPSAPGYLGTFDLAVMSAMQYQGVDPANAAAFAALVHLILWLPLTLLGVLCIPVVRNRASLREALEATAPAAGNGA